MGCRAACGKKDKDDWDFEQLKDNVQVVIIDPKTNQKKRFYHRDCGLTKKDENVMTIMNELCFGRSKEFSNQIDGNFISIYNQKTGRFHYFCQRLQDIEIENSVQPFEGKMWVPYINKKKCDWDLIVEDDIKIPLKRSKIVWKYESSDQNDDFQMLSTQPHEQQYYQDIISK